MPEQNGGPAGSSRDPAEAAALLLSGLQYAVFERTAPERFVQVNAAPAWFERLQQRTAEGPPVSLARQFSALEGFLPTAEACWASGSETPLQSDFFTETDLDGNEYHLLAVAVTTGGRHFLAIERADATYVNHEQLQIYAREMVNLYETIIQLNREVEQATQAKSQFLATMSHEMRTPLNAMLGMADLLAETELDSDQRRYVGIFQRAGANLLGLINDILDLSKVEAGHLELESVEFDLAETIGRVLELTRVRASAKGLELESTVADEVPRVLVGDPLRLRQILLNLLGNAMKFTDAGRLEVRVGQDPEDPAPGALQFQVRDTGIGIPPEKLESIFENFSQADSSTTRKYGGTGLGLAISKRLVGLMGGRIWVESEPGQGSTFLFTVRMGVSDRPALEASPDDAARKPAEPAPLPPSHILLADDSEDNRFLMGEYLKHSACTLDFAENGEIALSKMKSRHYDLVLMDAHMPMMDGYTATQAMRVWEQRHGQPPLPILALTADAFKEAADQSAAAGCNAHLTKPIDKATLVEAVRRYALKCRRSPERSFAGTPAGPVQTAAVVAPPAGPEGAVRTGPAPRHDSSLAALAPRYLKNMTKELKALRDAEAAKDDATVQRIGHNLHGNGASFGFPRFTDLGAELEQAAKEGRWHEIHRAVERFAGYLEQVLESSAERE
jgi:signal transduction histidine kinase/CheY-like chemotaxis protein/HPt (histidine-containing phosphotransfer) domain-containing protein